MSDGVSHLSDSVVACGIIPLLGRFRKFGWHDRPTAAELLACYAAFAAEESGFGANERMIMRELDIACIADVDWWARVVVAVCETEGTAGFLAEMAGLQAKLRLVADTLPNLLPGPVLQPPEPGMANVQVLLPPESGIPPHPMRLSSAIEAVCTLWTVACELTGSRAPLTLGGCTPSPEIAIVFSGPSAQIAELKGLMMQIWDRVVVSHSASLEDRIAIVPGSLPALDRLGKATPGALALRRDLEAGVRLFLEVGASIPEMDDPGRFAPARLLRVSSNLRGVATFARTAAPRAAGFEDADLDAIVADEHEHSQPGRPVWIGKARVG
jgi:hypothetical protein